MVPGSLDENSTTGHRSSCGCGEDQVSGKTFRPFYRTGQLDSDPR